MNRLFLSWVLIITSVFSFAQTQTAPGLQAPHFSDIKILKATSVKDQAKTGTCWCFAATSLLESEEIRKNNDEIDLSEMYSVRNAYVEKAKNYVLRAGKAQFGEGGLAHDEIRTVAAYGAVPESEYSGLVDGKTYYDHQKLVTDLKNYLDSILSKQPISKDWLSGYIKILDKNLGIPPKEFTYKNKKYTPVSFAKDVLHFDANEYVSLTSFTHQPYYAPFILQVPDNFANGSFYNLPLNELLQVIKDAINNGFTVSWDADVSNKGFMSGAGLALSVESANEKNIDPDMKELPYDAAIRQELYENLTTQDDHLMHITGIEKSKGGKTFFVVKNSWGKKGPFEGYVNVSEAYLAINTISIVVPRAALSKELLAKLNLH